ASSSSIERRHASIFTRYTGTSIPWTFVSVSLSSELIPSIPSLSITSFNHSHNATSLSIVVLFSLMIMVSVCIRLLFLSLSNAFIASGKYCRHHTTLVIASSSPSALAIFMRALSLSLMVFYHLPLLHLFSCHYHDRAYPLTFGPWPSLSSEFLQKSRPVPYRWRSAKHTTMVALPRLDAMRFSRLLAIGRPIPIRYQSSPEIHIRTPTGLPYFSAKYATEMIKRNAFTIKSASRP